MVELTPAMVRMEIVDCETASSTYFPFVTIAVPTLNEEKYIAGCLRSLISQYPRHACEILVLDGGSSDTTKEIVAEIARSHSNIYLFSNTQRLQSAAINHAASLASERAVVLIRADAHAVYPPDFVRRCVSELLRTGATSVVVPMRNEALPSNGMQRAIAAAQSSKLGNGGAAHRTGGQSRFVEHGHHAAFDLKFFISVNGYDESFSHNEDAELDHRATCAGGRIWMCTETSVTYFPRATLTALMRQYRNHGRGRAHTLRKHHIRPKLRQMAPLAALLANTSSLMLTPFVPAAGAIGLLYIMLCLTWGSVQAVRHRDLWLMAAGTALVAMHLSWAVGFLDGITTVRKSQIFSRSTPQSVES